MTTETKKGRNMWRRMGILALALALLAGLTLADEEPIVFADLGWDSAILQNRIAQYIVEKGYGFETATIAGGTLDLFHSLLQGEADIMMELWLPNYSEAWDLAIAGGGVVSLGESLSKLSQSAYMIPAYMQAEHPELDSIEDLHDPAYRALFASDEGDGKARLMSCPALWACNYVNAIQALGYGLAEHVELATPESEADLHASLYQAYEAGAAWLGYLDSVMTPALELEMVQLTEPAYSDACWATDKACAYEETTLLIAALPDLMLRAPAVALMLREWEITSERYTELALWRLENEASHAEAALWWLGARDDVWGAWVTEEAATAIGAALEAGELAQGWGAEADEA